MDDAFYQRVYDGTVDRRSGHDRRQQFPSLKDIWTKRRRRELRRKDDYKRVVLFDHYSRSIAIIIFSILILSVLDAFLTLFLIAHGAVEMNPVMAYFIDINPMIFLVVKYGLTSMSVVLILLVNYAIVRHFNFQAGSLLHYFAGIFALVVTWEIFLVAHYIL